MGTAPLREPGRRKWRAIHPNTLEVVMSPTDTSAEEPQDSSPEPDDEEQASTGEGTGRPAGTSEPQDYSGVDPQGPIDPDSPTLQPGG